MAETIDENRILDQFWASVAEAAFLHAAMLRAGHEHEYHDAAWFARLWLDTERTRPWTDWGTPDQIDEARRVLEVVSSKSGGSGS